MNASFRIVAVLLLTAALASCSLGAGSAAAPTRNATPSVTGAASPNAGSGSNPSSPAPSIASPSIGAKASGRPLTVPLKIVQGPTGSVLALVPVTIDGQGPFAFALDTGASNSTVDKRLAAKLNLPKEGSAGEVTGVAAMTRAEFLAVKHWKVGNVQLPAVKAVSVDLGGPNLQSGLAGLLGSDVLSEYGAVTVDYEAQQLVLRAKVKK